MANLTEAAGEVDGAIDNDGGAEKTEVAVDETPKAFSLQILSTIKSCQLQNGLRHGDHVRYRRYCAKKLRRLRKTLKFTHGRKQFEERKLEAADVTEARFLLIPLMNAERAWAYAMEMKEDRSDNSRKRFMKLRRFRKATTWSMRLQEICSQCADDRTALEAEAYATHMAGGECMERDDWDAALANFLTAAKIYGQLGNALLSNAGQEELFTERVRKATKSIEYCRHMVKRSHGTAASQALENDGEASSELQAKLNSVLAEARKKQTAELLHLDWRGYRIAVRSETTRKAILDAQDKSFQFAQEKTSPSGDDFVELFSACDDALRAVRADKAKAASGALKSEKAEEELALLSAYIKEMKLRKNIEHKIMLVDDLALRLDHQERQKSGGPVAGSGGSAPAEPTGRKVKASDLVRMYDTLLQNVAELKALPEPQETADAAAGELLTKELSALEFTFRFLRCFYVAQSYEAITKWPEAFALYERGESFAEEAQAKLAEVRGDDEGRLIRALTGRSSTGRSRTEQMERMGELIRSAKIRCHAKAFIASADSKETAEAVVQDSPFLLQRLQDLPSAAQILALSKDSALPFRVAPVPPEYQPVACKPCLFDVAFTSLSRPSLMHRLTEIQQQTATSRRQNLEKEEQEQEHQGGEKQDDAAGNGWFNVGGWFS